MLMIVIKMKYPYQIHLLIIKYKMEETNKMISTYIKSNHYDNNVDVDKDIIGNTTEGELCLSQDYNN